MTISVVSEETKIRLWFPDFVFYSAVFRKIAAKQIVKNTQGIDLDQRQVEGLLKQMKYCLKGFKGLMLVEVISSHGEKVFIQL